MDGRTDAQSLLHLSVQTLTTSVPPAMVLYAVRRVSFTPPTVTVCPLTTAKCGPTG